MSDIIKTVADEALATHNDLTAMAVEQYKIAKKGSDAVLDAGRASFEAIAETQQAMAKRWVEQMTPASDEAKA